MLILLFLTASMKMLDCCFPTSPSTTPSTPVACKQCAQNLIMLTTIGGGSHAFQSDVTVTSGACAVRTLTCVGTNANIELNNGDGVIMDGDDGAVDNKATLQVTCNAGGTGWVYMGVVITQAECASA
ncbi:hypothetical protein PRIPAC_77427 [Pristionchus pacificus]|uniref:C6 domain-containing protein n=1 Tax=Pristionchus pacificus TaxID=54126 RepID=A0A2A6CMC7_PRIPA|nr:hypothetical protein PRIPAC_77427 [Pristionchus pacificus]|eukprot:PDM79259.1 hypothetical protein PRIPAC_31838 [Pristionchus pacificus]